ncbi:MAG TPA: DUF1800 domain-containing protein [Thermoanaerobaculia bacterium]|nr:DUF1800 domain-containing protein [Thermoanaerobaculia bacterium]
MTLAQRLAPGSSKAGLLERRLVQRITLGATQADVARAGALGYQGYLQEQLAPETLDASLLEQEIARTLPSVAMPAAAIHAGYSDRFQVPIYELMIATLLRATLSPRQLFESLAAFWTDHFNIDILGEYGWYLKPVDDREVIRRHAMGRFPDLLRASAKSPAMVFYLTNDTNHKDHPNENYARELMELHTLGADNGYTQEDVREVARCFTGWTWVQEGDARGTFRFDAASHDTGQKVVLGRVIPAGGGVEDGEAVLALLAAHPNTARTLSRKLLRWFWGYEPPHGSVDQVAAVYLRTGGNIRRMLRTIFTPAWMESATPKLKRPFHLAVSALRALGAEITDPYALLKELQAMGHLPFTWSPPNGYPDTRAYWSGLLLPRWSFAARVVGEAASGVRIDLSDLSPGLSPSALVRQIDRKVANGTLSEPTREAIRTFLRSGPRTPARIREAVGLALASPEFQDY